MYEPALVSVFSGESRVVQPEEIAALLGELGFQYSLANLVWCNLSCSPSSTRPRKSFSILWRISCGATLTVNFVIKSALSVSVFSGESRVVQRDCVFFCAAALEFQYSLANLVWCNSPYRYHQQRGRETFQYSLANLVWCNAIAFFSVLRHWSFSILWRISCGATARTGITSNVEEKRFSILWRISCGATIHSLHDTIS